MPDNQTPHDLPFSALSARLRAAAEQRAAEEETEGKAGDTPAPDWTRASATAATA